MINFEAGEIKPRSRIELAKAELAVLEELEAEKVKYKVMEREFLSLMEEEGLYQFITVAKLLNRPKFGRTNLMVFLREKGALLKNSRLPSQRMIDQGYMVVKKYKFEAGGVTRHGTTTMVTAKGYIYITKLVNDLLKTLAPPPPPTLVFSHPCKELSLWLDKGWTIPSLIEAGHASYTVYK